MTNASTPRIRTRRAAATLVLSGCLAFVVAGCSGATSSSPSDQATHGRVAVLPSAAGSGAQDGSSTSAPATTHRIRSKLFETEQEEEADLVPYNNCVRAHGIQVSPQGKPEITTNEEGQRYEAASQACALKKPLPPVEDDPTNPKALIFNRAVAACLRRHGARYVDVTVSDGYVGIALGGANNDAHSIAIGEQYQTACQRQVSAGSH